MEHLKSSQQKVWLKPSFFFTFTMSGICQDLHPSFPIPLRGAKPSKAAMLNLPPLKKLQESPGLCQLNNGCVRNPEVSSAFLLYNSWHYGKSPSSIDKSTANGFFFNSFLLVYQRLNQQHMVCLLLQPRIDPGSTICLATRGKLNSTTSAEQWYLDGLVSGLAKHIFHPPHHPVHMHTSSII